MNEWMNEWMKETKHSVMRDGSDAALSPLVNLFYTMNESMSILKSCE